jgi:hypothetical protein
MPLLVGWLAIAAMADERPALSGPEQVQGDARFVVHYTDEGVDAVSTGSVERVLAALNAAADAYDAEGWRSVAPDSQTDNRIDAYLRVVDVNGYAHPDERADGTWTCWLEIDPNMANSPALTLESVTEHEFHHCVEYGYQVRADGWIYEATTTWEQYRQVHDSTLDVALGVLWATRLSQPEAALDAMGNRLEYAQFLLIKFLDEADGADPTRIVRLWEDLEADPDWRVALEAWSERERGVPFVDTLAEHGRWNAFACNRDDGAHYDPDELPCVVDAEVAMVPLGGAVLGGEPFEWSGTDAYGVFLAPPADGPMIATCEAASGEVAASVEPAADGLVVAVAGLGDTEATCTLAPAATDDVAPGCGCASTGGGGLGFAVVALLPLIRRARRGVESGLAGVR